MQIIRPHNKISRKVEGWKDIAPIAFELRKFANEGPFVGFHKSAYAIHHSQVSEDPLDFTCLSEHGAALFEGDWLIANPEIVEVEKYRQGPAKGQEIVHRPMEGCMSWPFRKLKKVDRFVKIRVRYLTLGANWMGRPKLVPREREVWGVAAQIFQHEMDHGRGKMIHEI